MPRVKKLTDYAYSPTDPASEDAIRTQIDDSIQEVYDAAAKTDDAMDLTTDQTVATGVKTFAVSPIVPTPTTEYQVGTKKYTDDAVAGAVIGELPESSVTDNYLSDTAGQIKDRVSDNTTDIGTNTTDISTNANGVDQSLNPIEPDSVVSQLVTVTTPSTSNKKFTLDIQTTVTGGPITINRDGGGALSLKTPDGTDVEELSQDTRFFDIIDDTTVFTLASKGGAEKFGTLNIYSSATGTALTTIRANVTGKGKVKCVVQGATATYEWYCTIDGVRYPSSNNFQLVNSTLVLDFPFDSSFQFYSSNDRCFVIYELDGSLGLSQPSPSTSVTNRINVTGSGKLKSIVGGTYAPIEVDGVFILGNATTGRLVSTASMFFDYEYSTGFKIYTAATDLIVDYEVY